MSFDMGLKRLLMLRPDTVSFRSDERYCIRITDTIVPILSVSEPEPHCESRKSLKPP